MGEKYTPAITDQDFRDAILADRSIEDSKIGFGILAARDGRGQNSPAEVLQHANTVNLASTESVHVQVADIHTPELVAPLRFGPFRE
jgi:hypothetical protein